MPTIVGSKVMEIMLLPLFDSRVNYSANFSTIMQYRDDLTKEAREANFYFNPGRWILTAIAAIESAVFTFFKTYGASITLASFLYPLSISAQFFATIIDDIFDIATWDFMKTDYQSLNPENPYASGLTPFFMAYEKPAIVMPVGRVNTLEDPAAEGALSVRPTNEPPSASVGMAKAGVPAAAWATLIVPPYIAVPPTTPDAHFRENTTTSPMRVHFCVAVPQAPGQAVDVFSKVWTADPLSAHSQLDPPYWST